MYIFQFKYRYCFVAVQKDAVSWHYILHISLENKYKNTHPTKNTLTLYCIPSGWCRSGRVQLCLACDIAATAATRCVPPMAQPSGLRCAPTAPAPATSHQWRRATTATPPHEHFLLTLREIISVTNIYLLNVNHLLRSILISFQCDS